MSNDTPLFSPHKPGDDLADKVLSRIEEEHVVPRSRWYFWVKDRALWVLLVGCLVIGAASAAAMLFVFANAGWEYRALTHDGWASFLLETAPIVWISICIGVVVAVIENIRHTKTGYRYSFSLLLGFGILATLVGGVFFYLSGFGKRVEEDIGPRLHLIRRPVTERQQSMWMNPAKGLLAGEVVSVADNAATFRLRTFDGQEWTIDGQYLNDRSRDVLARFPLVRVIGIPMNPTEQTGATFRSCFVFPWQTIEGLPMQRPPQAVRIFFARVAVPLETNGEGARTTACEGVRPYAFLKHLQSELRYEE